MPRTVTDVDMLQEYVRGVLNRADHHAPNVDQVALTIAGAIIWRKDPTPLKVFEREGEMKNVLWFEAGGAPYAVSYDHPQQAIQVREGNTRGRVLANFTNATPTATVRSFFESL